MIETALLAGIGKDQALGGLSDNLVQGSQGSQMKDRRRVKFDKQRVTDRRDVYEAECSHRISYYVRVAGLAAKLLREMFRRQRFSGAIEDDTNHS
jgi:hypothetical protein